MILQQKINSLTEEELYILIYILNEESNRLMEWHPEYFKALKPEKLTPILEKWKSKMKPENQSKIDPIKEKLSC